MVASKASAEREHRPLLLFLQLRRKKATPSSVLPFHHLHLP
jgi:hypothetical protein